MKLQLDSGDSQYLISSYGPGEIVVNEESLTHSFVIGPEGLVRNWGPERVGEIASHHLDTILEMAPELVLLGTGDCQEFPDAALCAPLMARGVGLEVMDTGAACRTYNILLAEGRRIAAGFMMLA